MFPVSGSTATAAGVPVFAFGSVIVVVELVAPSMRVTPPLPLSVELLPFVT
jgi:hypothetical protein